MRSEIIIVGAGAAGLVAAGRAAELGAAVTLFEHGKSPGRKLAITGKGRCNLTNSLERSHFARHFSPNGRFLRQSFSTFFSGEIRALLDKMGVSTVVERGGRVFPASGKARDIVDALTRWNQRLGVCFQFHQQVDQLIVQDGAVVSASASPTRNMRGKIVKDGASTRLFNADAVLIATGGISYPATGSTGLGYRLARSVGHSIVPVRPALVPLEVKRERIATLSGLTLKNVQVIVWINGKKKREAFGEVSFTNFGLSGPVILTLSGEIVDALNSGQSVRLSIDLKPALDRKKLDARLLREFDKKGKRQFKTFLKELLPRVMIPFCLDEVAIPPDKPCHQIANRERKKLITWCKELSFDVLGFRPFTEAIITAGGVKTTEVNPKTLESRVVDNLYFAGEVLDIQADTGGYNLQAAFSTGWLAAESMVGKGKHSPVD